jgi:hypothetical protein
MILSVKNGSETVVEVDMDADVDVIAETLRSIADGVRPTTEAPKSATWPNRTPWTTGPAYSYHGIPTDYTFNPPSEKVES